MEDRFLDSGMAFFDRARSGWRPRGQRRGRFRSGGVESLFFSGSSRSASSPAHTRSGLGRCCLMRSAPGPAVRRCLCGSLRREHGQEEVAAPVCAARDSAAAWPSVCRPVRRCGGSRAASSYAANSVWAIRPTGRPALWQRVRAGPGCYVPPVQSVPASVTVNRRPSKSTGWGLRNCAVAEFQVGWECSNNNIRRCHHSRTCRLRSNGKRVHQHGAG